MSQAKTAWVREQFCHQLDFFDLQAVKKLQLIDIAACRVRFKLAEMNLIDTFLHTEHCRQDNVLYIVKMLPYRLKSFKMNKCVYKSVYYIYIIHIIHHM